MGFASIRGWTVQGGNYVPLDGGSPITPPPPPPPPGGHVWWVGLSRSTGGLNDSAANKQADTLARIAQFASQAGVSVAAMRALTMYHGYISGTNWDPTTAGVVQFARDNGLLGVVLNEGIPDYPTWAAGGYDANFLSYLQKFTSISTALGRPFKAVCIFEHEPENDANAVANAPLWSQGSARFAKIASDYGDPNVIFSTCHIPSASGHDRSLWNLRPPLNALVGTGPAQTVMDNTFCGLDPYPEMDNDGTTVQTLADRCTAAMNFYRSVGFTRFFFPEVAFFNYKANESGPGSLTAAQQAQRLKDQLWTYAKAQGVEGFTYFDVTSASDPRGDSRTLDTPNEQLEYAHIIQNAG